jgi:predicted anti-sigma-YlaC factor YlaD
MNCEEARELVTALIDNEIFDSERPLIEDQLKNCAACRRAYEQERALKTEIDNLGTRLTAPAEFHKRILTHHGI